MTARAQAAERLRVLVARIDATTPSQPWVIDPLRKWAERLVSDVKR